ncbi:hypothetical protein R6Q59_015405 [Mikania micrantha]
MFVVVPMWRRCGDLLEIQNFGARGARNKDVLQAIILTAFWCIWRFRNDAVFNRDRRSHQGLLEEEVYRVVLSAVSVVPAGIISLEFALGLVWSMQQDGYDNTLLSLMLP